MKFKVDFEIHAHFTKEIEAENFDELFDMEDTGTMPEIPENITLKEIYEHDNMLDINAYSATDENGNKKYF